MAHPAAARRLRSPSAARDERHQRFLRPGALARLRDSKIVARSLRSAASPSARLFLPAGPSSPAPAPSAPSSAGADGAVPHFLWGGARGPRCPLRKKLAAARGVVFLPPPLSPDAAVAFLDAFASADMVAAH